MNNFSYVLIPQVLSTSTFPLISLENLTEIGYELGHGPNYLLGSQDICIPNASKLSCFQVFIDSICSSTIFSSSTIFLWDSSRILGVVNLSFSDILGNKPCNLYFTHMPCTIGYPIQSIVCHHFCRDTCPTPCMGVSVFDVSMSFSLQHHTLNTPMAAMY